MAKKEERFIKVMEKVVNFHDENSHIYTIEFFAFIVGIISLVGGFFVFCLFCRI